MLTEGFHIAEPLKWINRKVSSGGLTSPPASSLRHHHAAERRLVSRKNVDGWQCTGIQTTQACTEAAVI